MDSSTGRFWLCLQCRRHVPMRLDRCQCGLSRRELPAEVREVSPSRETTADQTPTQKRAWTAIGLGCVAVGVVIVGWLTTSNPERKPLLLRWRSAQQQSGAPGASAVFDRVAPAIVVIHTKQFGGTGQGSGIVVASGLVVTNRHVVESATEVVVRRGTQSVDVPLENIVVHPKMDVALLRAPAFTGQGITMRAMDQLNIGEPVYALGAPAGLELTLSEGIISALRSVGTEQLVQTTAPISPGSSGGGLFDREARLVGITVGKRLDAESANFALPSDAIELLVAKGEGVPLTGMVSADRERSVAIAIFWPRMEAVAETIWALANARRRYYDGCYYRDTVSVSGGESEGDVSSSGVAAGRGSSATVGWTSDGVLSSIRGSGRSELSWGSSSRWREAWQSTTVVANETTPQCRMLASDITHHWMNVAQVMEDGERAASDRGISVITIDEVTRDLAAKVW